MCFTYDRYCTAQRVSWPRARKQHQCSECSGDIGVGEQHHYEWQALSDGETFSGRLCEACVYLRALLYATEIAEGCDDAESWAPYGGGYMREDARDRGWTGGMLREVV